MRWKLGVAGLLLACAIVAKVVSLCQPPTAAINVVRDHERGFYRQVVLHNNIAAIEFTTIFGALALVYWWWKDEYADD